MKYLSNNKYFKHYKECFTLISTDSFIILCYSTELKSNFNMLQGLMVFFIKFKESGVNLEFLITHWLLQCFISFLFFFSKKKGSVFHPLKWMTGHDHFH